MEKYIHKVQYYETDQMGITHHSNYIRWMEEARVAFLDATGWGYQRIEKEGIISPVLSVDGKYKKTTTFGDEVAIVVRAKSFNGLRLVLEYEMTDEKTGELCFIGTSEHCFLNRDFKVLRLKKDYPEIYEIFASMV